MTGFPVTKNPLKTRSDVQQAVRQLCEPLKDLYSPGCARLKVCSTGVNYTERTALMEAFSRPIWGLAPLLAGGGQADIWAKCLEGIKNGTDPQHPEYWGRVGDMDQLVVEMPPLALALATAPEKIWEPLSKREKDNLVAWLDQCNHQAVPDCNWIFMVVLVNMALKKVGAPYNHENMDKYLKHVEEFYLSDGWYADGYKRQQRDYYIPFAIYYYGLIYAKIMEKDDPENAVRFKERAVLFARDFIYWFASDGSALAFGRSLTYRFAQCAFWGALAFADVRAVPWGIIKGLYLRHLRWWFKKPIFNSDGILTIGYGYPNLNMSEFYNAPGSPYWAFKAFLPLACPEDHPFWQAEEQPLPELEAVTAQEHPHMVICRSEKQAHVFALTAGQFPKMEFIHNAPKYSKFAYSNVFAFSVPREAIGLEQGAYDSMLALSDGQDIYRVRRRCEEFEIQGLVVYSKWRPFSDVEVKTWLIPANPWHVRIHRIDTHRPLKTAEGGFAIASEKDLDVPEPELFIKEKNGIVAKLPWATSGIINLAGKREPKMVAAKPNTNLMEPRTVIPTLTGELGKGKHRLVCAVMAEPDTKSESYKKYWQNPPQATVSKNQIAIRFNKEVIFKLVL